MRLYSIGDDGEAVRDIQSRLEALGLSIAPDVAGSFGEPTRDAVLAFQRSRGLPPDGIVGPDTWQAMVGAGYRLGDRLLYHRVPMMRGDDVADLQRRLNALGFDTGKVDGIFGPDTLAGLLDFQSNRRLPEDGIAGPEVAVELALVARATDKPGRDQVREQQWLATLPHHLIGQKVYVDAACMSAEEARDAWQAASVFARIIQDLGANPLMSRSIDTAPDPRTRAARANRLGVDFIVSFAAPQNGEAAVLFFSSRISWSSAGRSLAEAIAGQLGLLAEGRSIPMLVETRAPAVVVESVPLDGRTGGAAAQGVIDLFSGRAGSEADAGDVS